jgi:hypothetical protein
MKKELTELGQKMTNLINMKLNDPDLSKEDYDLLLTKLECMVTKELNILRDEIIEGEVKTIEEKKDEDSSHEE